MGKDYDMVLDSFSTEYCERLKEHVNKRYDEVIAELCRCSKLGTKVLTRVNDCNDIACRMLANKLQKEGFIAKEYDGLNGQMVLEVQVPIDDLAARLEQENTSCCNKPDDEETNESEENISLDALMNKAVDNYIYLYYIDPGCKEKYYEVLQKIRQSLENGALPTIEVDFSDDREKNILVQMLENANLEVVYMHSIQKYFKVSVSEKFLQQEAIKRMLK